MLLQPLGFAFGELWTFETLDIAEVGRITSDDPKQLLWKLSRLRKLQRSQLLSKVLRHVIRNDVGSVCERSLRMASIVLVALSDTTAICAKAFAHSTFQS